MPGVIISLAAIILIIKFVDWQRLLEALRTANYWILLVCLGISVIWLMVRGLVWRTLLMKKATYRQSFLTVCEGYLLNNFLPFRLGEVGRAFLLGRKAHLDFMEVLPTVVIERSVDLAFAAIILLSAIPFVVGATEASQTALLLGSLVLIGLVTLFVITRKREWVINLYNRLTSHWPRIQKLGNSFLMPLFTGLGILTDGGLLARFLLWMCLDWLIALIQYYLLILAFFPAAQPIWAVLVLGATSFGNAIPSAPGAVGTFEGALSWALTLVTHNPSAALAVAIVGHLFNYLSTGAIGLYALSTEGETLMSIYRQLRRRQEIPEQE